MAPLGVLGYSALGPSAGDSKETFGFRRPKSPKFCRVQETEKIRPQSLPHILKLATIKTRKNSTNSKPPSDDTPEPQRALELLNPARPKHIPIIVPRYDSFLNLDSPTDLAEPDPQKLSRAVSSITLSARDSAISYRKGSTGSGYLKSRHVEIVIPSWAQPVQKQPDTPPRVSVDTSAFINPFATFEYPLDVENILPSKMSHSSPDSSRTNTMDSMTSAPSPSRRYSDQSGAGSSAHLSSMHSSQSNLAGGNGYESVSEQELPRDAPLPVDSGPTAAEPSPARAQHTSGTGTPTGTGTSLSGLVCNVHRTTGKEPRPLVGATTTILGDKLYVFGGRRLSKSRPHLTSNLYELDLIKRHWTKLDTKGDVPLPRYFHSMCALGDNKLVCYGGMSPASHASGQSSTSAGQDPHSEVIVMSDIHIYDVPSRTWTNINTHDSPQGRYAHCATVLPSSAVFASTNAPMSAIHHNPAGANPNQGTLGISLDGTGGAEMVVVGGQDSANHYIEQISIFNLRSLKWTTTEPLNWSCGAYRSVVSPLTTMRASEVGAGPRRHDNASTEGEDPDDPGGSGSAMLVYSNYNFLDVKLELQVRAPNGTLTSAPLAGAVSPPGLRFPNGGVINDHFIVSGTFLTSSKQEYALWALDLRTLTWSRIEAGGNVFSQGSWNRGVLWNRRNAFVILGNRKRSLVEDYNNRRINFSNICLVELEAFGLYDNPRHASPTSSYISASAPVDAMQDPAAGGRPMTRAAEELGALGLSCREIADMDFLAIDGTRIPASSRMISKRWGPSFITLLREGIASLSSADADAATLRPSIASHPSRNSSITITPSVNTAYTGSTIVSNRASSGPGTRNSIGNDALDLRNHPPLNRPRTLYLPHTAPTIRALLHYLYTSSLPSASSPNESEANLSTPQVLCSLLQLACPYRIDGLLEAVIESLHGILDGRNAAAIFNAAAMAAGGGEGIVFASTLKNNGYNGIPPRSASLVALQTDTSFGPGATTRGSLRLDTDMANSNGRATRNTLRPLKSASTASLSAGNNGNIHDSEEEVPLSASTAASMNGSDLSLSQLSIHSRGGKRGKGEAEIWTGGLSAVVGLQKRGLRGLMEGRRMRERGRSDGEAGRVGLGIV
ncbi:hypothetical protein LTR50_006609 [Elasticomyces elasticus]|nr:hypothetical protein LTR50_006609 [Elasticomyces elasticus]